MDILAQLRAERDRIAQQLSGLDTKADDRWSGLEAVQREDAAKLKLR
jgi:hypothetical protein